MIYVAAVLISKHALTSVFIQEVDTCMSYLPLMITLKSLLKPDETLHHSLIHEVVIPEIMILFFTHPVLKIQKL